MRQGILASLVMFLLTSPVQAGVPRESPPIADTALANFLDDLAAHLNTLECLTVDPNGSVLGRKGDLKCATISGCNNVCMNTSDGPNAGTTWSCFCPSATCPGGSDTFVQYNDASSCGGDEGFTFTESSNLVNINEATDGDSILLRLDNDQANASLSTNETAQLRFGFGNDTDVGRLSMEKVSDFTSDSASDGRMRLLIDIDNVSSEQMRWADNGVAIQRTVNPADEFVVNGGIAVWSGAATDTGGGERVPEGGMYLSNCLTIGSQSGTAPIDGCADLDADLLIRDLSGSDHKSIYLDAREAASGAGLIFQTNSENSMSVQYETVENGIGAFANARYLSFTEVDQTDIASENPSITFEDMDSPIALTMTSGVTITTQRWFIFPTPTINGIAGGGTETCTNCATVYIQGAPSGSNITITNPYALWIDDGNTRFDGQVTLGTSTVCLMFRDTDDGGWTECDALDGVLTCGVDADGVCD